jgi:hypothetical protein
MAAFRRIGVGGASLDASVERSLEWDKSSADLRRQLSHIDQSKLYHCFTLRTLLKHSPRTPERITFAQRLETPAAMHSVERLRFLVMLFLAVFLGLSFLLAYQALVAGAWDLFLSLAVAASAGAAIYMGALLRVKIRSPGPISDA